MNLILKVLYILEAVFGIVFSLFIAFVAWENLSLGMPEIAPARFLLACVLLAYSSWHLKVAIKTSSSIFSIVTFPIIYVVFGIIYEYASRGYLKNWAPASENEALIANLVLGSILVCIVWLAVFLINKNKYRANHV